MDLMADNIDTISFRLSSIEQTLAELKDVIIENKLQARDITDLKDRETEILQALNAHDKRIRAVEQKPVEEKAKKWQQISDTIFKSIVTIAVAALLVKMGLQ